MISFLQKNRFVHVTLQNDYSMKQSILRATLGYFKVKGKNYQHYYCLMTHCFGKKGINQCNRFPNWEPEHLIMQYSVPNYMPNELLKKELLGFV